VFGLTGKARKRTGVQGVSVVGEITSHRGPPRSRFGLGMRVPDQWLLFWVDGRSQLRACLAQLHHVVQEPFFEGVQVAKNALEFRKPLFRFLFGQRWQFGEFTHVLGVLF
jgi:hypothetical protein